MTPTENILVTAVISLALVALASVGGIVGLTLSGHETPEGLVALGSGAAGALGVLMTRIGSTSEDRRR